MEKIGNLTWLERLPLKKSVKLGTISKLCFIVCKCLISDETKLYQLFVCSTSSVMVGWN
jgi:hypothetical protein